MLAKWRLRLFWAALAAGLTGLGVHSYLNSLQQTEPVIVAAQEIPARTAITREMLAIVQVNRKDRETLAAGAFSTPEQVIGQFSRHEFKAGDVLRDQPADFAKPGDVRGGSPTGETTLADFLPPETRAVSVTMDQQAVLGQQVHAGDLVDLIFTSKSDSTGGVYSTMLLQQVKVLDVGRPPADAPDKQVLVTLLVTAEQAVDVALAKRTGSIDLALAPPDPGKPITPKASSPLKFINDPARPAAQPSQASSPPPTTNPPTQSQAPNPSTGKPTASTKGG